jgi:hypothetical protein
MKILATLVSFVIINSAYAEGEITSAADICLRSATSWVINSEANQTKTAPEKIKGSEKRSLGSGANLYLMSVFVEGPQTGENTHWEVVGEFNLKKDSCKILLGRRYWAH